MAEFNGNTPYLRINSYNVESLWKSMEITKSVADVDVTAGSGSVYEEHAAGLKSAKAKLVIAYNDTQAATDLAGLYTALEVVNVTWGPEGNTSGKPCDNRSWLITDVSGPTQTVTKDAVVLEYSLVGTGTPTKDIHKGETF